MKQPPFLTSALAERSSIVRMELLFLDDEAAQGGAGIGPARLESIARRRTIDDRDAIDLALGRIADSSVVEAAGDLDARYGIVFSNAKNQRILSFYVDEYGRRGALEGFDVALSGQRLIEWLSAQIARPEVA